MRRRLAPLILLSLVAGWPDADAGPPRQDRRARSPVKAGARRQAMRRPAPRPARPVATTPEGRLRQDLEAIWAGRILRRGVTAVYVVDARTGKDIYAVHPDDKLNPASNVKLVSTATVLDLVGPKWRYLTRLFGPAPDAAGVVRGDVYLRGNSDPTLSRASLEELARTAARAGVKKIEGNVLLSDDALRETVAPPRIGIRVRAASRIGAAPTVTIDPPDSFVQVHVTATTTASRRARLVITAEPLPVSPPAPGQAAPAGSWDGPRVLVRVGGTIRKGRSGSYVRSLGMRSTFTGYALRQFLRGAGVEVTGGVRLADFDGYTREALAAGYLPIELARHRSQSMQELVSRVNKRSLNGLADRLLMTAGSELSGGGPPSMDTGLEAMYAWLERTGLDRRHIVLDTGSGLSHRTQITARNLVRVLRTAAGYTGEISRHGLLEPATFLASLAVGGIDGTLRGRFRGDSLRGRVVGKTGTLRDSIALSGFLSDDGGPALCFSIVTNGNQWGARYRIRREHDLMVAAMHRYLEARSAAAAPTRVVAEPEARPAAVERAASATAGEPEDDEESSREETGDDQSSEAADPATAPAASRPAASATTPASAAPTPAATRAPVARPEPEPRRPDAVAPAP
jgi:D-alanyl-D-alanine carboxypeptidase/D-alanyl-D-alanine-endopeptidase (penicillin-binding protein 4)